MGPSGHLEPSTTDKRTKITNETNLHKMNILILMLVFSVYSVNSFSTHRTKRAVYTIIPQLRDSSQELVDVGSPCPCEDGGSDCFLDTRLICRPEVRLTGSDTELSTVNKTCQKKTSKLADEMDSNEGRGDETNPGTAK